MHSADVLRLAVHQQRLHSLHSLHSLHDEETTDVERRLREPPGGWR